VKIRAPTILSGAGGFCNRGAGSSTMGLQKCPVCRDRKPKRMCPARGDTICTVCCATKRQVEIDCPPDCVYLSSARAHPPAVVQRRQERDVSFILPIVSELTDTQYRLLLLFQSATVHHASSALPRLRDEDVAEASAAAASTLETARKGIIYEHQAVSVPAQRLTAELGRVVTELSAQAGSQQARLERDAAVALRRLEQGATSAGKAGSPLEGDEAPVYLNLLARLLRDRPGTPEPGGPPAPAAGGGLIIPP